MKFLRALWLQVIRQHDPRIYLLFIPAIYALVNIDAVLASTWSELALALPAIAGLALVLRKILYDHVDMTVAADKALESPVGAGLVVLAISIVTASIIVSGVLWLH